MNLLDINSILSYYVKNFKPEYVLTIGEFQRILHVGQLKQLKKKLGLPEEYQPGSPIARSSYELNKKISRDLEPFKRIDPVIVTEGNTPFPKNFYYPSTLAIKQVRNNIARFRDVTIVTDAEWNKRVGSYAMRPNLMFPIANFMNGYIRMEPKTIRNATFVYLIIPPKPVYGVKYNRGFAEYVASTSTELLWDDINIIDIIGIVLGDLGINIPSAEIIQIADKLKGQGI